jgi:hypothetical protein
MYKHRIDNYKKCRQIDDNFDGHATGAILNSLTTIGSYMCQLFLGALFKVNNFGILFAGNI